MCGNCGTGGALKSVRPAQFSERKGEKGKSEKKNMLIKLHFGRDLVCRSQPNASISLQVCQVGFKVPLPTQPDLLAKSKQVHAKLLGVVIAGT